MVFEAFVDKVVDFVWNLFGLVEEDLFFVILPVQGQIFDADVVPVVLELRTGRVDDARHLIRDDELKILCTNLIADEQPILDLDDANEVLIGILNIRLFIVYVPLRN